MSDSAVNLPRRWASVNAVLAEFRKYLSSRVPPFQLIEACNRTWLDAEYRRLRPPGFPGRLRGVYLIFDESETLQYVGLATTCFDKRVWTHDEHLPRRFTDIIAINDAYMFLAPSLEYFLVVRLKPCGNRVYTAHGQPELMPCAVEGESVVS
jgi:hypothetical protein